MSKHPGASRSSRTYLMMVGLCSLFTCWWSLMTIPYFTRPSSQQKVDTPHLPAATVGCNTKLQAPSSSFKLIHDPKFFPPQTLHSTLSGTPNLSKSSCSSKPIVSVPINLRSTSNNKPNHRPTSARSSSATSDSPVDRHNVNPRPRPDCSDGMPPLQLVFLPSNPIIRPTNPPPVPPQHSNPQPPPRPAPSPSAPSGSGASRCRAAPRPTTRRTRPAAA